MPHYLKHCSRWCRRASVCWIGSLFLYSKDCRLLPTGNRCGMSGGSRTYPHLRSTSPFCVDVLGARTQRWSLPGFLDSCPWPHVVSRRIFVTCTYGGRDDAAIVMLPIIAKEGI